MYAGSVPNIPGVNLVEPQRRRVGRPAGAVPVTDRARLLDAAERSIAIHGPTVSMEAIALEAAVTKPVIYQYIGNKDALIEALAARHMVRINAAAERATGLSANGRERVRCFIAAFFDVVDADRNMYVFLASAGANENWPQRTMSFADQSARPLATVLARLRVSAGADPAAATTWAYGIVGMLHYVALWWIRDPALTTEQVVDHVTEIMWSGLAGPATNTKNSRTRNASIPNPNSQPEE